MSKISKKETECKERMKEFLIAQVKEVNRAHNQLAKVKAKLLDQYGASFLWEVAEELAEGEQETLKSSSPVTAAEFIGHQQMGQEIHPFLRSAFTPLISGKNLNAIPANFNGMNIQ